MAENQPGGTGAFIVGALLGGVVGAAVGLWQAPCSGKELRDRLVQRGAEARAAAEERVIGERMSDAVDEGKALAQQRQIELSLDE